MLHESPQELVDRSHRNGHVPYTQSFPALNPFSSANNQAAKVDLSSVLQQKHVLPFLLGAIFTGAVLGFFWKRK